MPGSGLAADRHQGSVAKSHILIAGQAVQSQSTQGPSLQKPATRLKVAPRILVTPLETQKERDAAKSLREQKLENLQKKKEEEREGAWVGGAAGCAAAAASGASTVCDRKAPASGQVNERGLGWSLLEKQKDEAGGGGEGNPELEISEEDRERIEEERRLEEAKEAAEESREKFNELLEKLKKAAEQESQETKAVTNP